MPPLGATKYILRLAETINGSQATLRGGKAPFEACLAALEEVGIRTDYDLLLQSDILVKTPPTLHSHIRSLRVAVLEHFACTGTTAADLLDDDKSSDESSWLRPMKSGIEPLDALLDGGILGGHVVELCSKDSACKTRVAIEYATGHLVSDDKLPAGSDRRPRVFMLQSSPLSIWQVEQSLNCRLEDHPKHLREVLFRQAMEQLMVVDCNDLDTLLNFLYSYIDTGTGDVIEDQGSYFEDLLIIDSIRPLIINTMQQNGNGYVAIHAVKIAIRAIVSSQRPSPAAVIITNDISQRNQLEQSATIQQDPTYASLQGIQPSLGTAWALVSHVHVYIFADSAKDNEDSLQNDTLHSTSHAFTSSNVARNRFRATILKSSYTFFGRTCVFAL
ncbi:hypothetical protein COEREDRAFT_96253 [Coemansia reversa NRRL 1564]|uniref:DNA recombination and repair protein Rad51-like C-terminal domain-containing protein n=1 Tax=Coemansia reversa (strain ATCC 12441 / NRRL 1564) TaxID=763665 RepID=A0A2G5BGJ3_COERN|nr:hypothetical protein COEREDRAFT_96253 [Coemansia reversa NRRL 1564]|eukprot:PIA18092.1 hypothetical protein COEREDRAFT_96253 [Coemansia reversa NRRL 1564]